MNPNTIVIIGGGLSGLYAAYRLYNAGYQDVALLEAKSALGGRILSVDPAEDNHQVTVNPANRFDLGPSWYWPQMQPQLHQLITSLGLSTFEQFDTGNMVVDFSSTQAPIVRRGFRSEPTSVRLLGGMYSLIEALHRSIPADWLQTNRIVQQLSLVDGVIQLQSIDSAGATHRYKANHVFLALPPRLAADRLTYQPALPTTIQAEWSNTSTWMAPHAKYFAIYERPFWREQGLSGQGRGMNGPLGEIHDASIPSGHAALFGFLSVPASTRQTMAPEQLKQLCRTQLTRMFGEAAATPIIDYLKDWSTDPFTATSKDQHWNGQHVSSPSSHLMTSKWAGKLTGIASEWSTQFPGYLAGAVDAVEQGVTKYLADNIHNGYVHE